MPTHIDSTAADHFATAWAAAWNARDLDAVLALYDDAFEMTSPYIIEMAGEPSGTLRGKEAVAAYWRTALARMPRLHFEIEAALPGVRTVALLYRNGLKQCVEVLEFNAAGKVVRGEAHYLHGVLTSDPITSTTG